MRRSNVRQLLTTEDEFVFALTQSLIRRRIIGLVELADKPFGVEVEPIHVRCTIAHFAQHSPDEVCRELGICSSARVQQMCARGIILSHSDSLSSLLGPTTIAGRGEAASLSPEGQGTRADVRIIRSNKFGRSQTGRYPRALTTPTVRSLRAPKSIGAGLPLLLAGTDSALVDPFAQPLAGRLSARCMLLGAPGAAGTRHVKQSAYSHGAAGRPGLLRALPRAPKAGEEQTSATRALSLRSRRDRPTDLAGMMQPTSARFRAGEA